MVIYECKHSTGKVEQVSGLLLAQVWKGERLSVAGIRLQLDCQDGTKRVFFIPTAYVPMVKEVCDIVTFRTPPPTEGE
jgi:hypothetical protein